MDGKRDEASVVDFVPETCGCLMDFVRDSGISYETMKNRAEEARRATRWSGAGKNMLCMGSFEPSRFDDTFVGNYRRAGVYKKPPTRTTPAYEYWLDERDRLLAVLNYNVEEWWKERLGPYYFETFRANADDALRIFVCWKSEFEGKKSMDYVFGYRYVGETLMEKATLEYIGGKMTTMRSEFYSYGADQTLLSREEYRMSSPDFYLSPVVRAIKGDRGPVFPTLTYRDVVYQVNHWKIPRD